LQLKEALTSVTMDTYIHVAGQKLCLVHWRKGICWGVWVQGAGVREFSEGVTETEWSRWGMWHARDICEMHTKFWLWSLKGRDHLEAIFLNGRVILK